MSTWCTSYTVRNAGAIWVPYDTFGCHMASSGAIWVPYDTFGCHVDSSGAI